MITEGIMHGREGIASILGHAWIPTTRSLSEYEFPERATTSSHVIMIAILFPPAADAAVVRENSK